MSRGKTLRWGYSRANALRPHPALRATFPRPGEGFSSTGNFAVLPETASPSPSPSVTPRSPFCRVSDIFPRSGEVCQRERLWRNHPLCAFIRKFTAMPRALPLGELPSGARLRGLALPPLRRHFHRKQARQPPLAVQAPSVKMQCRAVRRPPGIDLFKNNTSADYAQSSAARI